MKNNSTARERNQQTSGTLLDKLKRVLGFDIASAEYGYAYDPQFGHTAASRVPAQWTGSGADDPFGAVDHTRTASADVIRHADFSTKPLCARTGQTPRHARRQTRPNNTPDA